MFKAIGAVSREIHKCCGEEPADLETITKYVKGLTAVDEIFFVPFDTPASNPIWGAFQKWTRQPTAYASFLTSVEVRYATHLDEAWRRFVVCKEMCHALEDDEGAHTVTAGAMDNLVNTLSLLSNKKKPDVADIGNEFLAEVGALELLCPSPVRKKIVSKDLEDYEEDCKKFGIPYYYATVAFDPHWIAVTERFMKRDV